MPAPDPGLFFLLSALVVHGAGIHCGGEAAPASSGSGQQHQAHRAGPARAAGAPAGRKGDAGTLAGHAWACKHAGA